MKLTDDEHQALIETIRSEWNKAEEVIKSAEQICGEAIIPSVKELRYAGRRVVDAFDPQSDGDRDHTTALLKDAIFNCHCARHDAIDVSTAVVAANLNISVKKIGYDHILKAFPKFAELRSKLSDVRGKIRTSRLNRANRDAIYDAVHAVDLPHLAALYDDFIAAEDIMKSLARRERLVNTAKSCITVASLIVAILACTADYLKKPEPAAIIYVDSATGKIIAAPKH